MHFSKIVCFLVFLFLPFVVYADDFSSTGDNSGNKLYQSVAYTIGSLPSHESSNIVDFDEKDVVGVDTSSFRNDNNIDTVTDFGGARTIPEAGDRVSLPPEARIDIIYLYKNNANHAINLSYILVPLSSGTTKNYDLMEIVKTSENIVEESVNVLRTGEIFVRNGKYLQTDSKSKIEEGESGDANIGSMYVKNPLEIKDIKINKDENTFGIKVILKNNINERLENLVLKHLDYSETFALDEEEEKTLEYTMVNTFNKNGEIIDLGNILIENPNSITRCAVGGEENFRILGLYTMSVFSYRLDGGIAGGAFTNPDTGNYCVTIIPYTMASDAIEYVDKTGNAGVVETNPNYMFEDLFREENTDEVGVVSGVSTEEFSLPKTFLRNRKLVIFLVVDMYLWYSYVRKRKNYEDRNNNTKVCAKHS